MNCIPPMPDAQVVSKAKQAWTYEVTGKNWVGRTARASTDRDEILALSGTPAAAMLLNLLRVSHPMPDAEFAVDQIQTAKVLRWSREMLRSAIQALLDAKRLARIHAGKGKNKPRISIGSSGRPCLKSRHNIMEHPLLPALPSSLEATGACFRSAEFANWPQASY